MLPGAFRRGTWCARLCKGSQERGLLPAAPPAAAAVSSPPADGGVPRHTDDVQRNHTAWRAALTAAAVGSSPPADESIVRAIQLCLARALALAQGRCATARPSSYGASNRPASRGGANLERVGEADDDLQMRVARSYVRLKPSRAQISPQYRHRRGRGGKIDVDRTVLRCHDWARVLRRKDPRHSAPSLRGG